METTRNNLPQPINVYFNKLSTYLETKLYFFGSVQRIDYLEKESDIDTVIFTDNMESMLSKIQNFLNIDRRRLNSFVSTEIKTGRVHNGYKVMYNGDDIDFKFELLIYDSNCKQEMLDFYETVNNIPTYASILLLLLKYLKRYYVISADTYFALKKKVFKLVLHNPWQFVVLSY
jgi:predicted nucleotidyltransferase